MLYLKTYILHTINTYFHESDYQKIQILGAHMFTNLFVFPAQYPWLKHFFFFEQCERVSDDECLTTAKIYISNFHGLNIIALLLTIFFSNLSKILSEKVHYRVYTIIIINVFLLLPISFLFFFLQQHDQSNIVVLIESILCRDLTDIENFTLNKH